MTPATGPRPQELLEGLWIPWESSGLGLSGLNPGPAGTAPSSSGGARVNNNSSGEIKLKSLLGRRGPRVLGRAELRLTPYSAASCFVGV